jgi:hypothetical protein
MKIKVTRIDYVEDCGECPYCEDLMTGVGCDHPNRPQRGGYLNRLGNCPPEQFPVDCPLLLEQETT